MRSLILAGTLLALPAPSIAAATLNKCIDARGAVTYSNLPCSNARETRTVEIDPAPLPDPARATPAKAQPAKPAAPRAAAAAPQESATIQLETRQTSGKPAAPRQCDTLSDKLGRVFDKMDAARRQGYTQKQMDAWNQEIKDLERKKQQSGCF